METLPVFQGLLAGSIILKYQYNSTAYSNKSEIFLIRLIKRDIFKHGNKVTKKTAQAMRLGLILAFMTATPTFANAALVDDKMNGGDNHLKSAEIVESLLRAYPKLKGILVPRRLGHRSQ